MRAPVFLLPLICAAGCLAMGVYYLITGCMATPNDWDALRHGVVMMLVYLACLPWLAKSLKG